MNGRNHEAGAFLRFLTSFMTKRHYKERPMENKFGSLIRLSRDESEDEVGYAQTRVAFYIG